MTYENEVPSGARTRSTLEVRRLRARGRQAGKRAATVTTLDEHQGIAEAVEAELKVRGWSAARLAFASDLYAGVPRRVWGYDCCAWCGREGHGIGHAMLAAACPVRSRIAARARAAAFELEPGDAESGPTPGCTPEGVPCPPFEEVRLETLP